MLELRECFSSKTVYATAKCLLTYNYRNLNLSVGKIYISRPNRDQLRKMQLQGLQLGIEPATMDL